MDRPGASANGAYMRLVKTGWVRKGLRGPMLENQNWTLQVDVRFERGKEELDEII